MSDFVLYRFFDADGGLLYVGKSVRAWQRFAAHRSTSEFYPEAASVTLQRGFESNFALSAAEVAAIKVEKPRFNIAHSVNPRPKRPGPCQEQHHCRKPIGSDYHVPEVCQGRDECERMVADRVDAGELSDVASRETHARVRSDLAAGVHGCWEHYRPITEGAVQMARVLRAAGEPMPEIAKTLGVSRATLYRTLAERGE
jgi:hypothetical protein